jgi:hypothetical protein
MKKLKTWLYISRREILKRIVPELVWPKLIVLDDAVIPLRGAPYSFGVKRVLAKGNYEVSERLLLSRVIKAGDVVFEFGGSIGILATIAAGRSGVTGKVISIEASETLAAHTRARLKNQKNVKILTGIGYPVWEAPALYRTVAFIDDGNSLGGAVDFSEQRSTERYPHRFYDIKGIVDTCDVLPSILLIDIEGSEIVFLEKDVGVPKSVVHIIIELHPGLYGGIKEKEIVMAIAGLGFKVVEEISHVVLFSRKET